MFFNSNIYKWITGLIFWLSICLIVGLLLFNYATLYALIFSVVLVLIIKLILINFVQHIVNRIHRLQVLLFLLFFLFLLSILLLSLTGYILENIPHGTEEYVSSAPIIENYKIIVYPKHNLTEFPLKEKIKLNEFLLKDWLTSQTKLNIDIKNRLALARQELNWKVNSVNIGLVLKELYIRPVNLDSSGKINLKLLNNVLQTNICEDFCPESSVELVDFPMGSFYQAQNAENLHFSSYLDSETITWTIKHIERGVKFAYIPPPYYYLRSFFNPILKLASVNKWIIVTIGGIISFIFTSRFNQSINVENISTSESKFMSESYQSKYDQRNSNNQFVDTIQSNSNVNFHQNNYTYEQKQNLTQAAVEIQQLLYQLSKQNLTNTEVITEAIYQEIKRNPTLKARLISALKTGGLETLKTIFNHPLFSIPVETIKGWLEAE